VGGWGGATFDFIFLTALLFLPGWLILRGLGRRGLVALAAAPPVTAGLLGVAAIVLDRVGVRWGVVPVLIVLVLAVAAAIGIGRAADRHPDSAGRVAHGGPPRTRARELTRSGSAWVLAGLVLGAAIQLTVYLPGIGDPGLPVQNRDAIFHLNSVQLILDTGNASSLGGLQPMYGTPAPYYPAVWHAAVALVTDPVTVVRGANAMALVCSVVIWPLGLAVLARVVRPNDVVAPALAPVLGSAFAVFPPAVMFFHGQWPFGLSVALLPGTVALAVAALTGRWWANWRTIVAVVLPCLGVTLAQPSGAAALAVCAVAVGACGLAAAVRSLVRDRRTGRALVLLGSVVAVAVALAVVLTTSPQLRSMAEYPRPEGSRSDALWAILGLRTLVPYPWVPDEGNLVLVVLTVIGVVALLVRPGHRWFPLALAALVVLDIVAAGPEGRLRALTAFWYKDELRLRALVMTFVAVAAAVGVAAFADTLRAWVSRASRMEPRILRAAPGGVAVLAVIAFAATTGLHREIRHDQWVAAGYHPEYMAAAPVADDQELEMIEDLPKELPDDAVLAGDPLAGVVLVPALTGLKSFVPVVGASGLWADQIYLMKHFAAIDTDPRVCEILAANGVEYYYEDVVDGQFLGAVPPAEGFHHVDTTTGFELLVESGEARVWEITACDPAVR
jgi:hypothetical protein